MLILFILFYCAAVAFLLYTAYTHHLFKYYTAAKAAASCGFTAVAISAFFSCANPSAKYFYMLLPCFVLCISGDILLGVANNKGKFFGKFFIRGVICFAVAHIGFIIAFSGYSPLNLLDFTLPVFAVFVTYLCSRHKAFRLSRMKYPAIIYSFFVGLCCSRGISAAFALDSVRGTLIGLGAFLFLISDASILLLYFTVKKPRKYTRMFNLLTYYIGLLCFALSCGV